MLLKSKIEKYLYRNQDVFCRYILHTRKLQVSTYMVYYHSIKSMKRMHCCVLLVLVFLLYDHHHNIVYTTRTSCDSSHFIVYISCNIWTHESLSFFIIDHIRKGYPLQCVLFCFNFYKTKYTHGNQEFEMNATKNRAQFRWNGT